MRKLLLGLLLVISMLVASCAPVHATEDGNFMVGEQLPWSGYILIDKVTGVEYIVMETGHMHGGMAITPRLNADGSLFTADQE